MRTSHQVLFALFYLFLISVAPLVASAQQLTPSPQPPKGELESLRRQVEEQKTQIEQLQTSLRQQAQALEKQQHLLEEIRLKTEHMNSVVPEGTVINASTPPSVDPVKVGTDRSSEKPQTDQAVPKDDDTKAVESGYGKIKFNGLFQGWFAAGNGGFRDTFRIRRVELKFTGEITPQVKWTVMLEPSRALSLNNSFVTVNGTQVVRDTGVNQGSRILQDAFVTLSYFKRMSVDVGQLKLPLSLEGSQSSSRLDTVERALFISDGGRGGNLGDVRDIGAMIYGPLNAHVDYQVGLFNGVNEHQNDVDRNDQKAIIGRVVIRPPFLKGLQVGGSGAWGNGGSADRPRRDRLGAELLFTRGRIKLKSELMTAAERDLHRVGYYGHLGFRFHPRVEGIFRYDVFDPDTKLETSSANITERDYITGLNYYIKDNHAKIQFNYLRKTFADGIVPARNLLLVNLQTSW